MPRSGAFILDEMRSLAKQLAFVPSDAARRQLSAIRLLLEQIQPQELYGWNDVIWRITQFRIEKRSKQNELKIVGESLQRDLTELALRLSRRAPEEFGSGWTIPQLAREWRVTERTIHRWRKMGLPSCWMRRSASIRSGSLVMIIRRVDAASFAASHLPLVQHAARTKRLTPSMRDAIFRHANESAAKGERRISVAARSIASEVGVSTETVRALLAKNPAVSKGKLVGRKPRVTRDETRAFAAWCRGMGPAQIARTLRCSQPAADRLLHKVRMQFLRSHADAFLPPNVEVPPTFAREEARDVILAPLSVRGDLSAAAPMRDARAWLDFGTVDRASPTVAKAGNAIGDGARLMAVRFLLWSTQRSTRDLSSGRASERQLDRIETDLRWARLLMRSLLIKSMPMIVTRLKLWSGGDIERLAPEGIKQLLVVCAESLLMVIHESDPANIASGRVRVDRAVSLAVERRLISMTPDLRASPRTVRGPIPMRDPMDEVCPWQIAADALARRVARIPASLGGRTLWWMRLGWEGDRPMTSAEMSLSQGKPISVIAGILGRAISPNPKLQR